jgi:fibronectin type 3 domain-containing protein
MVNRASGYKVYRGTSLIGDFSSVGNVTATSYTDTGLITNATYYYSVSAYNSVGESSKSSPLLVTVSTSIPATPTNLVLVARSSSSIQISWDAVTGVTGYNVYRATSSSGDYSFVGYATMDTFTDGGVSKNTTYYYKVSAYNSVGESSKSSVLSATTLN